MDIVKFNSETFGKLVTFKHEEDVYFYASDVAKALGYSRPSMAVRQHVDEEDTFKETDFCSENDFKSRKGRPRNVINEVGVYDLILNSKMSEAKKFRRWLTKDVIPSVRKHGVYASGMEHMNEMQRCALEHTVKQVKVALDTYDSITDKRFKHIGESALHNMAVGTAMQRTGLPIDIIEMVAKKGLYQTKEALEGHTHE